MKRATRSLFSIFAGMSRRFKRIVFLSVDVVVAPLSLLLTIAVLYNDLTPLALSLNVWPLFPFLAATAALFSTALGIPKIKLKSYESQAILMTGAGAALLAASLYVFGGFMGYLLPPVAIILFCLIYFLSSVGARAARLAPRFAGS